ncbi:MAG TPA: hypothetical protein VMW16_08670 [Sedimentisphaerales bacterium]|nr:hypothetical protein [Sedimentisphaerales bacterium]
MLTKFEKQANLTGIAAGAICTAQLPADRVHHGLYLVCRKAAAAAMSEAEIEADVGKIIIRLDGDIKIEATAAQLFDVWRYWYGQHGAFTIAGLIPIPFTRPNLIPAIHRAALAWGMKGVESYTIEVAIAGVATLVSIEVWCEVEDRVAELGRHLCIGYHPQSFASTGVQELNTLPFGDNDKAMLAIHIGHGSGAIKSVNCKATISNKSEEIYAELAAEANNHILRQAGRTNQTGWYHIDFAQINDVSGYLPSGPISAFRQQIDWGTQPNNYPVLIEEVRGLTTAVA